MQNTEEVIDLAPYQNQGYVAWIDIMGTRQSMIDSTNMVAKHVFDLHFAVNSAVAILRGENEHVLPYPVMDGFYVYSQEFRSIKWFCSLLFNSLAKIFCESGLGDRFIVRSSIAFGYIVNGHSIPDDRFGNEDLIGMKNSILLGTPMIQAYESEGLSPPFGIHLHDSARSSIKGGAPKWMAWWEEGTDSGETSQKLHEELVSHFNELKQISLFISYDDKRIESHEEMAKQYFSTKHHNFKVGIL
jgi:hypothetical protein